MSVGKKNPSLAITECHYPARLVMPNGDPRDGFFLSYPHTHDIFFYYSISVASAKPIQTPTVKTTPTVEHVCPKWIPRGYISPKCSRSSTKTCNYTCLPGCFKSRTSLYCNLNGYWDDDNTACMCFGKYSGSKVKLV